MSTLTSNRIFMIAVLVTLLLMIGIFVSDIYVPALPAMAEGLQATQTQMELSVGLYFLSFSVSQLFYGPLADHFGRKPIILLGLFIALAGSIICMLAQNGDMLILGRIVQGIGMASPMPLSRIVLRDLFSGMQLARWNSYIGAFLLLAPALAPIVGGYLTYEWNWQSIFVFLILLTVAMTIATVVLLPETRAAVTEPLAFELRDIFKHYVHIVKNKNFLAYSLAASFALSGMVAYLALSAFLFQEKLGFTVVEYSWMAIFVSVGLVGGMLGNAWLLYRVNYNKLIIVGLSMGGIGGVILLSAIFFNFFNATSLITSIIFVAFGCSLVFANASSGAFSVFEHRLGMVGAVYGAMHMFIAGAISALASFAQTYADIVLGVCFLLLGVFGLWVFLKLIDKSALQMDSLKR